MADQFNLSGRVALVTGAGQNVGAGIAITLAQHGAQVLVNDLVSDRARAVAESIGDSAQPLTFDVTDLPAVERALDGVGPVDILVNNAGVAPNMAMVPFRESEPTAWRGPLELNSIGVMNCAKAVIEGMCSRRWGRIITISSGAGTAGTRLGVAPYAAGKGAGIAFTRTLALEVARLGVTANTLAIGLMGWGDPNAEADLARSIPVGRLGSPEDIAAACVWLASEAGSWVTGQTIEINGGSNTT